MATVIAITNQKGGVGKTTTAVNVADVLKLKGYKVLLIDTDPQGNATDTYRATVEGEATLYDLLFENEPVTDCVQVTEHGEIIAADPLLKEAEKHLSGVDGVYRLKERIEPLQGKYDYILIDTPPTLGVLLTNALTAADSVIIPITADRYGVQGLAQLQETIASIKKYTNHGLTVDGFLLVKYNQRTNLAKELRTALQDIAARFDTVVFDTTIRESTKAKEAQTVRQSLYTYAGNCTTALDYMDFVNELIERKS